MSVASAAPTVGTTATTFPQYWFRIAMGHHGYGKSVTQRLIAWTQVADFGRTSFSEKRLSAKNPAWQGMSETSHPMQPQSGFRLHLQ